MANVRGQGLQISDFNPQAPQASGLPDIPRGGAPSADALSGVANTLAAQVGKLGDTLAEAEGTKAGKIAGADPNWQPSDDMTVRGRAFDKAASEVYLSKLASNFQGDALNLYQQNQNDPAAFKTAYEGLVNTYRQQHVFPEAAGWFDAKAGDIANSLRTRVLNNWESDQKDKANASLVTDLGAADVSRARLLAIDPHDSAAERESFRIRDENVARIKASADAGNITQTAAAKLIMAEQNKAQNDVITARAATLGSADEIDAYRAKLRQDFAAGKLPGLQDFDTVDSSLATMSKSKKTQADQALRDLDGKVSDFLDRFGKGLTPSSAEWLTLEQQGQKLGPAGAAAIDAARSKLMLRQKIASLSVNDADSLVSSLEQSAKGGGSSGRVLAPNEQKAIASTADRLGISPSDLRAVISYETGGSFSTGKWGGKDGKYLGLIQFGPEEQRQYGVQPGQSFEAQMSAVERYLTDRGVRSGDDLKTLYKIVNGGHRNVSDNASDGNGTIVEHVAKIASEHGGGMGKTSADILSDARAAVAAKRSLIGQDPALAAEREGIIPQASTVDFSAAPDALGAQMRARVTQAEAIGTAYQRPPQYIRPDEKPAMQAVLRQGGDKALDLIDGVTRGAGPRAPQVLAEIGGDAPELAHAGVVSLSTGDRSFARQVAEAIRARSVQGASVSSPKQGDLDETLKSVVGMSLNGVEPIEKQRTLAAAKAWAEQEFSRRNIAVDDPKQSTAILQEAVQRARGQTVDGSGVKFGGIGSVMTPGYWGRKQYPVQVPADVRADRFGDVLDAINDSDLKTLANPPVAPDGSALSAADLRRATPIAKQGGYMFGLIDQTTGIIHPVHGKDGSAFILPFKDLEPELRRRAPSAFR
ncbi:hypothetical protein SAMN06265338_103222 [Rhodoblastus acidophilus]|uniref:Phage tail lysozyme domain-containing protein n=1 Tax=Rhodoblastus acidophilus TaxID=1074 RepID=A0A212RB77_RHOAC|nr:hypothetical protein [Rhodoblastus acidophilus]PPQ39376.1 hypothetical protein CKO16_06375 [Rhodoblastus acidophilus]RAI19396.1 hypothetical protein CH337_12045 [Rhodoblastus acidophilus]SNB69460.1 hypothetical protein SAMN06265338_103222 [Rhodoblastus acidophilus]